MDNSKDCRLCTKCTDKEKQSSDNNTSSTESKLQGICLDLVKQECIQSLRHTTQCSVANCNFSRCQKMKRVLRHVTRCRKKNNGSCQIAVDLMMLCGTHSKYCLENVCHVPFCKIIKTQLKQHQLLLRSQQDRLLQGRIVKNRGA